MDELFTLELPKSVSPQELSGLKREVAAIDGVDDTGTLDARGVDPATIGLWVQAAAGVIGVVSTGLPLLEKIIDMIRGRNIKGAKLRFEGVEIDVDRISPDELKSLVASMK